MRGTRALGLAAGAGALAVAGGKFAISRRPSMPSGSQHYAPLAKPAEPGEVRVTFFGVSTLAITDGETTIITDGFFTRPGIRDVLLGSVSPNGALIDRYLRRGGIEKADAVFVAHSHYDHALDSPAVAWRTGALLVGSESTLNIGRGYGLPANQMQVADLDEPMRFGNFSIQCVLSDHSPNPKFKGIISAPIHAPAPARAYRMGQCYSFVIKHTGSDGQVRSMLVHASAGFLPGCLQDQQADVAFLGMAPIGRQPEQYREDYWRETVATVGSKRIYPVHHDDFTKSLERPLVPLPYWADDFDKTWSFLMKKQQADGVEVLLPEPFLQIDPFDGL